MAIPDQSRTWFLWGVWRSRTNPGLGFYGVWLSWYIWQRSRTNPNQIPSDPGPGFCGVWPIPGHSHAIPDLAFMGYARYPGPGFCGTWPIPASPEQPRANPTQFWTRKNQGMANPGEIPSKPRPAKLGCCSYLPILNRFLLAPPGPSGRRILEHTIVLIHLEARNTF